jgi:hypothetical protein
MVSMPLEAKSTIAALLKDTHHNKRLKHGWRESQKNLMRLKIWLCNNCGGKRIFKMPEPNGLGEGSSL